MKENKERDVRIAMLGNVDSGKCVGFDTPVIMSDGKIKMVQNIVLGDKVMGDDSNFRTVSEITQGSGQLYKVNQRNGDDYVVNENHILSLVVSYTQKSGSTKKTNKYRIINEKKYEQHDVIDISVKDYLQLSKSVKLSLKGFKTKIEFPEQQVPIDPYIIGLWLGDGTSSNTGITNQDSTILKYLANKLPEYNCYLQYNQGGDYRYRMHTTVRKSIGNRTYDNFILNSFRELNLINDKHIPDIYKYNSRNIQLRVLAGLLDTDGYYYNNVYEIIQKNKRLSDDIKYLVSSLGMYSSMKKVEKSCMYNGEKRVGIYYRQNISGSGIEDIKCLIPRKKSKPRESPKNVLRTGITIEKIDIGDYYGFELDGNGRFLLGDFTVTHNSSLVGVLSKGILDDGRGSARKYVLTHPHELEKGQTSAVSLELMGYDKEGNQVIPSNPGKHVRDFKEVSSKSHKRINLIDLCGHEKYLKTTIFGLCGNDPNLAMIIIGANAGPQKMTREHLSICFSMNIPVIVVITKIDMAPPNIFKENMEKLNRMILKAKRSSVMMNDRNIEQVFGDMNFEPDTRNNLIPIFYISNVTGVGLPELKKFIKKMAHEEILDFKNLSLDGSEKEPDVTTEYTIDSNYMVDGVGLVVGGHLSKGELFVGQKLFLGPDPNGDFRHVQVKSLHKLCISSDRLYEGQHATLAIKTIGKKDPLRRSNIRKGMVLIATTKDPKDLVTKEFSAEIRVLHHSTTIEVGYSPVIHIGVVRQSAKILEITDHNRIGTVMRTGSKGIVRFQFLVSYEYIKEGTNVVFREGNARGVGKVLKIYHGEETVYNKVKKEDNVKEVQ
jgi:GTPase